MMSRAFRNLFPIWADKVGSTGWSSTLQLHAYGRKGSARKGMEKHDDFQIVGPLVVYVISWEVLLLIVNPTRLVPFNAIAPIFYPRQPRSLPHTVRACPSLFPSNFETQMPLPAYHGFRCLSIASVQR